MNLNETTRLASQLLPLAWCCAHHCQLSEALLLLNGLVNFHIVWNGLAFKHVPDVSRSVYILSESLVLLLLVLHKCLKQSKHSTKDMYSDDCIRFVSPN
jgi:lipoprotein signal peptidase